MNLLPLYTQIRFELYKLLRMPAYLISLLSLPLFFYLATATNDKLPETTEGYTSLEYLLCTLGTFGVFGISLFGFGVNFAVERSQGWYHSLRVAPVSMASIFGAKMMACMLLSGISVLMLFIEAWAIMGVTLSPGSWMLLFVSLVAGCIPLAALGMVLGTTCGPNSAAIIAIMVYLGISSLSGLLAPLSMLRKGNPLIAELAVYYPTYHVYASCLSVLRPFGNAALHVAVLVGYTALFSLAALYAFRHSLNKTVG